MNHKFITIDEPEYINIAMSGASASFIEMCDVCGFTIWHEKEKNQIEYGPCDIFFLNQKEIYNDYFNYEELCAGIKLTCEEILIKNILE